MMKSLSILLLVIVFQMPLAIAEQQYIQWRLDQFSITKPLGGLKGDAERGSKIVLDSNSGNCLACHKIPNSNEPFQGNIGPPLHGIGSRLKEGELRLRVINERLVNPDTIMPAFYLDPKEVYRLSEDYWGETILTAQQVEDVVAYLVTLK